MENNSEAFVTGVAGFVQNLKSSFVYLPINVQNDLDTYVTQLMAQKLFTENEMRAFVGQVGPIMPYLESVVTTKDKLNQQVLKRLVLFSGTLHMKLFANEANQTRTKIAEWLGHLCIAAGYAANTNIQQFANPAQLKRLMSKVQILMNNPEVKRLMTYIGGQMTEEDINITKQLLNPSLPEHKRNELMGRVKALCDRISKQIEGDPRIAEIASAVVTLRGDLQEAFPLFGPIFEKILSQE